MATGLLKGLAAMKAEKARLEAEREARERPRANYFNWKNNKNKDDKNVVYVRFLQELDSGVDGFDPERGLPLTAVEHQAPGKEGFKRRASCTLESEGQCYACERHREDRTLGWQQRRNFYIWALVDYKDGEGPQPVVISRTFGSSFVDNLILEVENDEENQITNKMFKIIRTGSGKSTSWNLREARGVELFDDTDVEITPLEDAVLRNISYEEQPAYYGAVYKDGDPTGDEEDAIPTTAESLPKKAVTGELTW